MLNKKLIPALLIATVLAASASTSAMARDRDGGNGLAIAAGIIGAVAVGSMIANAATPNYAPAPVYQQVYQPAPQPVYYQPQPVYYQPAPVYVRPAPVYVEREYRPRQGYQGYYRDGGYYNR